jgi:hypothetical protein
LGLFFIVDIAFADSHTIWAQHSSGTFSQLDIRQSSRPIDAIPRTSVSWEAGGGLAFVSGRKSRWEVPFDDVYVVFVCSSYKWSCEADLGGC